MSPTANAGLVTLEKMIAGHRVLRLLATGKRSQVWLAPDDLVLKVLTTDTVADEAMALEHAQGDHVVALVDAAVGDDESVLIFPRLPRGSLADVLAGRAGLDAGEAVTVLAPIAAALARMHAAGVAHSALTATHVLFRADGAPMLIGFGAAQVFEAGLPEVALERVEGVVADRAALSELAAAVLTRVTGPRASAGAALASRLHDGGADGFELWLTRELFELAAARPIKFEPDDSVDAPRRAVGVVDVPPPNLPSPVTAGSEGLRARVSGAVATVLESGPGDALRSSARVRWQSWSARQRKIAIGAIAGLTVLVVALVGVPGAPATRGPSPVAATSTPEADEDAFVPPSAVTGDDPLAALNALLTRRVDCFRDLSLLCLDDVDEQGSSALDADRAALDALVGDGAQAPGIEASGATIVETLGDSVLVALAPDSEPASVLLLKGEAGWRIRDYIAARTAD